MIRAVLYLGVAGATWMAEGFVFSRFLAFSRVQVGLMAVMYVTLFCVALAFLVRFAGSVDLSDTELPVWRFLSLAPMLVLVVGSFLSLPLMLLIVAVSR